MFKLSNLSLRRRLSIGFAIPLIALMALAGIGIQSIRWASDELSDMGTGDMPISVSASAINDELMNEALEYQTLQREYFALHTNEANARDRFDAAVKRFEEIVPQSDKNFEAMKRLAAKAKDSGEPADI